MTLDRRTVGSWVGIVAGVILGASLVAIGLSALAVVRLDDARTRLIERVGPARTSNLQLQAAFVNQETGVRGYLLTGEAQFLEPDTRGRRDERTARQTLDEAMRYPELDGAREEYRRTLAAARAWRNGYAFPAIAAVRRSAAQAETLERNSRGKALFDALRSQQAMFSARLDDLRNDARDGLSDAARDLKLYLGLAALLLLASAVAAWLVLRRVVTEPLGALTRSVRAVADGNFSEPIGIDGPREIAVLAADVETMRARIVAEAQELQRSNAELEQFAYVASHDLQEPLRKIVSFNQMLEKRYKGQLDERADQYIAFAVDGARRMQILINDLLAFSRVGRVGGHERTDVALGELVDDACRSLSAAIEETGATVEHDDLPVVHADRALLTTVLQNLIGNAIKFRGDATPHVQVSATTTPDGMHEIAVRDNGIGIAPDYAERIFVIFQRLHARSEYEGTGIGLAMCRKIIEHHGGRIWLDTTVTQGTTFRFTLPTIQETP